MQMSKTRQKYEQLSPSGAQSVTKKNRTRSGRELLAAMKAAQKKKPQPVKAASQKNSSAQSEQVRFIKVNASSDGQRLDNFLLSELKGVPKSMIYRVIRSGEVRINKGRVHPDSCVSEGDEVRIPPIRVSAQPQEKKAPPLKLSEIPTILYEDEHILAVDKPSGMASHGGSGISFGLIERMRASRPDLPFLELVHRLDRGTSGVLVLAKTRKALVRLHEMIREGQMHKTYKTLVKGDWQNDRQHVKFPLYKYVAASGERRVRVDEEQGLPSHSIFRLIERFGAVSLLEVDLLTGRTHQIRVHAAHLGFPLVGDEKYGDFEFNGEVEHGLLGYPFKRMFLHAGSIAFHHPVSGIDLKIEAPLPKECRELLDALERKKRDAL